MRWEYHEETVTKDSPDQKEVMNRLGSEGWELVAVTLFGSLAVVYTFKRPLAEERVIMPHVYELSELAGAAADAMYGADAKGTE